MDDFGTGILAGLCIGITITAIIFIAVMDVQTGNRDKDLINRGYKHYDQKTGELIWTKD